MARNFSIQRGKKCGPFCMIVWIKSIRGFVGYFIEEGSLPTGSSEDVRYKLIEDHLQVLFPAIRMCSGWGTNPTPPQCLSAFRMLTPARWQDDSLLCHWPLIFCKMKLRDPSVVTSKRVQERSKRTFAIPKSLAITNLAITIRQQFRR